VVPGNVTADVEGERARLLERRKEIGEEIAHDLLPLQEERMELPSLGHTLARRRRAVGERIALDDRHLLEVVGQDACREESGHAAAAHHSAAASKTIALAGGGPHLDERTLPADHDPTRSSPLCAGRLDRHGR